MSQQFQRYHLFKGDDPKINIYHLTQLVFKWPLIQIKSTSNLLWTVINSTDIGKLQLKWYALITSAKTIDDVYLSILSWEQLTFENVEDIYKIFPTETKPLKTSILSKNHKQIKAFICSFYSEARICEVTAERIHNVTRTTKTLLKHFSLWLMILLNAQSDLEKSRALGATL